MTLLLAMTIAGSMPVLLCLFLYLFYHDSFDAIHGIWLLRIGVFFYLVPVQLFYHVLPSSIIPVNLPFSFFKESQVLLDFSYKLQIPFRGKILLIPYWLFIALAVGCIFALLLFIQQRRAYKKFCQLYHKKESVQTEEVLYTDVSTPFTLGILHPHIFMPAKQKDMADKIYIYQHELYHIRHHDTLWKILCILALCIHWYNPFSWCLLFLYAFMSECAADQSVTQALEENKRRTYASMLIQYAAPKNKQPIVWQNHFSQSKHLLKRRLTLIMKRSYHKKASHSFFLGLTLLVSVILGSATVWAYSPLEVTGFINTPDYSLDKLYIIDENDISPFETDTDAIDFHEVDEVIINDDGTTEPLLQNTVEARANCKHTYAVKTVCTHNKNKTGGCVVKKYNVMCCTICQTIKSRKLISTTNYPNCPHK